MLDIRKKEIFFADFYRSEIIGWKSCQKIITLFHF
jgi:hypothetical protein